VRSTGGSEVDQQPHVLVMSATPIPRSLSLTLYGDLDLSIIDELPPGRQPIITHLVPDSREQEVWDACRQEMNSGRQVYVVHPVIEETEGQDLKSAEGEFQRLAGEVFPEFQVALLHGKLKPALKNEIMTGFAAGDIDMLVATTVVEVGLDVASASVMVIHNPERFGLAQLHQLRGRVGRGGAASTCWLVADPQLGAEARGRLEFFAGTLGRFRPGRGGPAFARAGRSLGDSPARRSGLPSGQSSAGWGVAATGPARCLPAAGRRPGTEGGWRAPGSGRIGRGIWLSPARSRLGLIGRIRPINSLQRPHRGSIFPESRSPPVRVDRLRWAQVPLLFVMGKEPGGVP
jgi:hypothetical protein